MNKHTLMITYDPADNMYIAVVPELPQSTACGSTPVEAARKIDDVIKQKTERAQETERESLESQGQPGDPAINVRRLKEPDGTVELSIRFGGRLIYKCGRNEEDVLSQLLVEMTDQARYYLSYWDMAAGTDNAELSDVLRVYLAGLDELKAGVVMQDVFFYDDCYGSVEYSDEDGCYFGKILDVRGLYLYEGNDIQELEADFRDFVDEYRRNGCDD